MYPSDEIEGSKGTTLGGQKVVLCVTGSAAAVRCAELIRKFRRYGAKVRAVMSKASTGVVTPQSIQWATGNPVVTELTGNIEHVELVEWADLVVVAPATANTVSKMAQGVCDTPVTLVASAVLGLEKPLVVAPAMHGSMYSSQVLQGNISRLKELGVHFLEPRVEEGKAKLHAVDEIVRFVESLVHPKDMAGRRVLITAGPTIERIDPIKILTNRSSGKMGIAMSRAAQLRGADVTLIYGPGTEPEPSGIRTLGVEDTSQMRDALVEELRDGYDVVVGVAAPQDLKVESPFDEKLRHTEPVELKLVPAPRVLDDVRDLAPEAVIVGFKAECEVSDEELLSKAKEKLKEARLDMVVANDVMRPGAGYRVDTNDVLILTRSSSQKIRASKMEIANAILDRVVEELEGRDG